MSVTEKLQHFVEALPADRRVRGTFEFTVGETVVSLDTTVDPPTVREGALKRSSRRPAVDVEARIPPSFFEMLCVPGVPASSDFILWIGHAYDTGEITIKGSEAKFLELWLLAF